jgi:dienelactone hydrolase
MPAPLFDLPTLRRPAPFTVTPSRTLYAADRAIELADVYFTGQPYLGRPTRAYACLARPAHRFEDSLPAVLLIHGGGGTADPQWCVDWAMRGYAALSVDLYGQGPDRQRLPDGGPDWSNNFAAFRLTDGLENTWVYQSTANCVRAVSVLAQLPDVDPARVAVCGASWGGIFCAIVMSLDDRVRAAVPCYGAGYNPRMARAPFIPEADGAAIRAHLDASNFLAGCRADVLWVSTATDRGTTPEELCQSRRAATGARSSRLSVNAGPGHTDPRGLGLGELPTPYHFADAILRNRPPLALIDPPRVEASKLVADYRSELPIVVAGLHWTTQSEKPWTDRGWQAAWADVASPGVVRADLPAERPLQAFFTTIDQRGALVSSEPVDLA